MLPRTNKGAPCGKIFEFYRMSVSSLLDSSLSINSPHENKLFNRSTDSKTASRCAHGAGSFHASPKNTVRCARLREALRRLQDCRHARDLHVRLLTLGNLPPSSQGLQKNSRVAGLVLKMSQTSGIWRQIYTEDNFLFL
jgi:hypothetical protein